MRGKTLTAIAVILLPCVAHAQRSVEYFIMNPAQQFTLASRCSPGVMRTLAEIECANAQQAGLWLSKAAAQQRAMVSDVSSSSVRNPVYFDRFPIARQVVLNECAGSVSAVRPSAAECRAAAISSARNPR